jgi:hypothetical protein
MKIKHLLAIPCIFLCLITSIRCQRDRSESLPSGEINATKEILKPVDINKINFYFENSSSMNGYLNGDNFRKSIGRILRKIEGDSLQSYFVNTKEYKTTNILDKIRGGQHKIKTTGTRNSDHKFIFTNAIKNAANNNLSIVVTDGIYSMQGGNLADVEVDIQYAFEKALKVSEIETIVLKMTSNFNGIYYSETCKPGHKAIKINQARPYYIFLFGNKNIINKALEEVVILKDLKGQEDQARFFLTKSLEVDYSILLNGEDKKGDFKPEERTSLIIKSIVFEDKFKPHNSASKEAYFQFAIAVDFSKINIPEKYLKNPNNYTVSDNTDYKILVIKDLNNIDQFTLDDVKKRNKNATHLIIVKGQYKLTGELEVKLDINTPAWIESTGTHNDCSIKSDTTKTFSFDRIMKGVERAYETTNNKQEYFKLKLTIKN